MSVRRIALALAITFGVGFGFVLSSCMPPVDGQASDFPPLTVGTTYELRFAPNTPFPPSSDPAGVLTAIGPYPWIEMESAQGYILQVNLDNVAYIAVQAE